MQRTPHSSTAPASEATRSQIRLRPALHLCSGDAVGAFLESAFEFEEKPVFSSHDRSTVASSPSAWVAAQISKLAVLCQLTEATERPIIIPVPAASSGDPNMVEACIDATAQTHLCHQELSLEFTDAALSQYGGDTTQLIRSFRQRGFRVSIDARKSASVSLPAPSWLMIDTLRIKASDIDGDAALESVIDAAASAGVAIVAQRPLWRDGDYLASRGIDYGLSPRADA